MGMADGLRYLTFDVTCPRARDVINAGNSHAGLDCILHGLLHPGHSLFIIVNKRS